MCVPRSLDVPGGNGARKVDARIQVTDKHEQQWAIRCSCLILERVVRGNNDRFEDGWRIILDGRDICHMERGLEGVAEEV